MTGVSKSSGNPWASQDYVIETHDQYPRRMVFRVFGEDKIKTFNIQEGEELTVSFDIDAHEYNNRWFNDIRAWRVDRGNAQAQPMQSVPNYGQPAQPAAPYGQPASYAQPANNYAQPAPAQQSAPMASPVAPAAAPAPASNPEDELPF